MNKYFKYAIISIIVIAIVATIVVLNINKNKNEADDDGKTKIVTSFYPMYIIAENLTEGANNVELVNMADVNVGCLHDYTLTTEDMKKVEDADIFIQNGLEMESFIDKVVSSNNDLHLIDSSKNVQDIISDGDETNPHIWTSLDNYILQVKNISEGLQEKDTANAEIYEENEKKYVGELEELKEKYLTQLKELEGKKAIVLNEAFEYMGQELKMDITTVKTNHEESTMSAEMMKNLIDKVKNEKIDIIIIDKNDNRSNAETIANETGAKIYELNSGLTGSLEKDAYIKAVEENIDALGTGLF